MRLLVGVLGVLVVLGSRSGYGHADEVAAPPAPTVNAPTPSAVTQPDPSAAPLTPAAPDGSAAATVVAATAVPPPIIVPPPSLATTPPAVAPARLLAPPDSDAIANAKALRLGGILVFTIGVPLTLLSQVLLGVSIVQSFVLDEADGPTQAEADRHARPYRIAAIVTTISGNIMIASGLAMWGTANGQLRNGKPRASTVGALYAAPSREGHGGVGGLVVHF